MNFTRHPLMQSLVAWLARHWCPLIVWLFSLYWTVVFMRVGEIVSAAWAYVASALSVFWFDCQSRYWGLRDFYEGRPK